MDSKSKGNKSKNKQVGLHQTKQLLHSKENHQPNEKATSWLGEIFANHIYVKELFSKDIKN